MPTVDEDLDASRSLLDTVEDPPGSNHNFITDWYADRVGDDGFRHAPWCAMSRSYTFDHTGGDLTYAYCPFIERDARAGINGLEWLAMTPEVGAWVLFDFAGHGEATHVGHVEAINADGTLITLEGNIADAYRREHRDFRYVHGFVRPPFDASPGPTPQPAPLPPPEEDMPPAPATCTDAHGRLWLFVRGDDSALWYKVVDPSADPPKVVHDWDGAAGGIITSGPAAVGLPDGRLFITGRGGDGAEWGIVFTPDQPGQPPVGHVTKWMSFGGHS